VSCNSSSQAAHGVFLVGEGQLAPACFLTVRLDADLGTAESLHTCGVPSVSQGMDEDAPGPVCRRCWEEEGATAPSGRMVGGSMALNAQMFSRPVASSWQPWELGQPGMSDGLEGFSCWTVEAVLCGSPFVSATNKVEVHGLQRSNFRG